jgi:imidazolonepropionase-like amidohydrolase
MLKLLSLVMLAHLGACASSSAATPPPLLLDHVTIIDGRGGPPLRDRAVLIRDGRIASIGAGGAGRVPQGTRRLDLTGRYLLPGLIDSHVHLKSQARDAGAVEQMLSLHYLRSGVTTVRDMGGNGAELAPLAAAAAAVDARSPRILMSALFTGGTSPFWMTDGRAAFVSNGATPGSQPWFRHLVPGADMEALVRQARLWGATGVKAHSGFTAAELATLGAAARRNGLLLWTHAEVGPARPGDAVSAGAASISHADMLAYEGMGEPPAGFDQLSYSERTRLAMAATPVESEVLGRLFRLMREKGTCLEPTLLVMSRPDPTPQMVAYVDYAAAVTARANREGVMICAGTDVIRGSSASLLVELDLLVHRVGLTPLQAITAATWNNARALGFRDLGLVEQGMLADLLVLRSDPSADISNLSSVDGVVLRGRYWSAAELAQ